MSPLRSVNRILAMVATEQDCGVTLDRLTQAAIEMTGCRNAMIAQMDEELGCLEVRHGLGADWHGEHAGEQLLLQVNKRDGIVAYVAATGKTYSSDDVRQEPNYRNLFESTISELALPIRDRYGRVRGVLNLESDEAERFGEESRSAAEAVALLAGIAIDRGDVLTSEKALIEVGSSLDSALTEEELIERVIQVAGEILRFQAFSIFILDGKTDQLVLRGSVGRLSDLVGRVGYSKGEGCTGWVCETGEPILIANPQKDGRWKGKHLEFPSEQIAGFLAVPVVSRGRCIGVLRAVRRTTDNPFLENTFTESDLNLLQAIAEQIATGLENIRNVERLVRSERMIAWGELSAKSSHMIGNRVFALKGDVNELGHLLRESPSAREALQEVQESLNLNVMRIEEILQDFRDFVTATQLELTPGDVNGLVAETVREVLPSRASLEVGLSLSPDLPSVMLDDKKLRRAISELLENAVGHAGEGALRVETAVVSADRAKSARQAKGRNMVRISVEDTGPGIPEEAKSQIFQPFYSSRVKGMGLGLSIVKGIVDAHGGTVSEEGKPGEGAKFVILLPVAKRQRRLET